MKSASRIIDNRDYPMRSEKRRGNDRRKGGDRRSWQCQLDFPYLDGEGTLLTEDRRRVVERRIQFLEHIDGDRRKPLLLSFIAKN